MTAARTSTIMKEQKTMLTYCLYLSGLTKKNTESFPDSWWRIWTPSNRKTANNLGSSLDRRMTEFFFFSPNASSYFFIICKDPIRLYLKRA